MSKCLNMLNNDNFIKLTANLTKINQKENSKSIWKIKSKVSKDEQNKI